MGSLTLARLFLLPITLFTYYIFTFRHLPDPDLQQVYKNIFFYRMNVVQEESDQTTPRLCLKNSECDFAVEQLTACTSYLAAICWRPIHSWGMTYTVRSCVGYGNRLRTESILASKTRSTLPRIKPRMSNLADIIAIVPRVPDTNNRLPLRLEPR